MKNTFLGLFAAATLFAGSAHAADASSPAPERTTAYQRAVRAALTERGWRITRDEAGKLVAERASINGEDGTREFVIGAGLDKRVRLNFSFRPDGQGQIATSALASVYYYDRLDPYLVGQSPYQSFAYRSPKLTQEYLDIVAEADSHTTGRHGAHIDGRNKVAAK